MEERSKHDVLIPLSSGLAMLSPEQIRRYQEVYREELGVEIPYGQAQEEAIIFLNLIETIFKPIPKADYDEIVERHDALLKGLQT
jgi:hypothetical protein